MSKNADIPEEVKECFVIMPISDTEDYDKGHFTRVYEDIIQPAIKDAGFKPYRADDNRASDIIHIDILKRIIEAPMAVCDLSSRNPNVLFELGIRQAFNKPVVLMKDDSTQRIFDVELIRYTEYSRNLKYRDVINTQITLSKAITDTMKGNGVNSIIKLLSMNAAQPIDLSNSDKQELALDIVNARLDSILELIKQSNSYSLDSYSISNNNLNRTTNSAISYNKSLKELCKLGSIINTSKLTDDERVYIDLSKSLGDVK